MSAPRRISYAYSAFAVSLTLCFAGGKTALADSPADNGPGTAAASNDAQAPVPQENFFSSLKQAFNQDFDHAVIRGHFDLGSASDSHRYYCLVDTKTGKRQPNGVSGQPSLQKNGMTGIKVSAVSLYSCSSAEQQGILITSGYVLNAAAAVAVAAVPQPPVPAPTATANAPAQSPAIAQPVADSAPYRVDVAGVRLGMSPDEVRAVLRSKKLLNYFESQASLGHGDSSNAMQPVGARFVNVIAAWTAPAMDAAVAEDWESYEVMFTPVPGKERAMAIVHSSAYSPANAVHERALQEGLVKKYGDVAGFNDLPAATWRVQRDGSVQFGDSCNRRTILGGLKGLNADKAVRPNLALKTTPDEFGFQIERCGVALITEDHSASGAPHADRMVTQVTVTAYSPSIGMEGATRAGQLMQMATGAVDNGSAARLKDPAPNL